MLSDDAKGLAACLWSLPIGEKTVLTFHMREMQPTIRALNALHELVEAGYLGRKDLPGGGVSWSPARDMTEFKKFRKLGNFALTTPMRRSA